MRTRFDAAIVSVQQLTAYLFEAINPFGINKQGPDVGQKHRTGIYSTKLAHLEEVRAFIAARDDAHRIAVEMMPLINYARSAEDHQNRLTRFPEDSCHLPAEQLTK